MKMVNLLQTILQRNTAQGIKIKAIKAGYHKEDEKQNNGQNLFQQKEPVVGETMHEL